MKRQILDSPLLETSKYAFEDVLRKDEAILWKGKPVTEKLFSLLDISGLGFIILAIYYTQFLSNDFLEFVLFGALFFLIYLGHKIYRIINIRNIHYAITPKRILWTSKNFSTRNTFSIYFTNIKWAEMEDNAIFIRPKDYDLITFETHNAKDYSIRDKPTLENIENMPEVYELIEKHIYKIDSK